MTTSSSGDRGWRQASDERLRQAYAVVERGFADLDRQAGLPPIPWRRRADEVLARVRAELGRRGDRFG